MSSIKTPFNHAGGSGVRVSLFALVPMVLIDAGRRCPRKSAARSVSAPKTSARPKPPSEGTPAPVPTLRFPAGAGAFFRGYARAYHVPRPAPLRTR